MLYLLRHGLTDWNKEYKLQGWADIPLNDTGKQMAEKAREECKDIHFDVVFCSPLTRARQTAEIFLEGRNLEIHYDDRLKEISFGQYEGDDHVLSKPEHPVYPFFREPENYVAQSDAESLDHLFARTGEFLREKVEPLLAEGKDVLIVGHGAMNSSIICQRRGWGYEKFWDAGIENCKLMKADDITAGNANPWRFGRK